MRTRAPAHLCICVCMPMWAYVCVLGRVCGDYVKPNAVLKHDSLRVRVTSPRHLLPPLLLHLPTILLILSSCPESFHPWPIDLARFVFLISSPSRPHPFILLIQLVRRKDTSSSNDNRHVFVRSITHTWHFFLRNGVFHRFRIFMEIQKTLSPVVVYIYLIYYIFSIVFYAYIYIRVCVFYTLCSCILLFVSDTPLEIAISLHLYKHNILHVIYGILL